MPFQLVFIIFILNLQCYMKDLMKLSSSEIFELFLSEAPHSGMDVLKACACWSQNLF